MRHSWALGVFFLVSLFHIDAHAKKKAGASKNDGLSNGLECVLRAPLEVKAGPGKKAKSSKLARESRVKITDLDSTVRLKSDQGTVYAARAALAKVCERAPSAAPPERISEPIATARPLEPEPQPQASDSPYAPPPAPRASEARPVTRETLQSSSNGDREEKHQKALTLRRAAWAMTIIGVIGVGTGVAFTALALVNDGAVAKRIDAYNAQTVRTQAEFDAIQASMKGVDLYRNVAIATGVIGVAALTTGIILFAVGENPAKYENGSTALRLTPTFMAGPNGASFGLVGQF
jgi:hypothetical protein